MGGAGGNSPNDFANNDSAMTPIILLPDGVGIRNFVLGPFLSLLAKHSGGLVLHPIPDDTLQEYAGAWNGHY